MLLADTSIWIEHFRKGHTKLADRLSEGLVLMHPCVSGELACGNLQDRASILWSLEKLPAAKVAADSEVLLLIESKKLWGRGLGWVDVQLLASSLLSHCSLWTLHKRLAQAAADLKIS